MPIEQSDRDAATDWLEFRGSVYDGNQIRALGRRLAAHREAAEQRGYDRAIVEVVVWLRNRASPHRCTADDIIAAAIERGEFKTQAKE